MKWIVLVIIFCLYISANLKPDFNIILHFHDTEDAEDNGAKDYAGNHEAGEDYDSIVNCKSTINVLVSNTFVDIFNIFSFKISVLTQLTAMRK